MPSNLPSSFSHSSHGAAQKQQPSHEEEKPKVTQADSTPAIIISILALMISIASFYVAFFMEKPLTQSQKESLKEIAQQLRELQNKDIMLGAPVETRLYLDQVYPAKDMFPETFNVTIDFAIPIEGQLVGLGTTGQPVYIKVKDELPVKSTIPLSNKVFGNTTIRIAKEFPVEARFSSVVKVRSAYGKELNAIIDKLEALAADSPS
ncbi:MAG: hypothetical protein N3G22_00965 [Candidatus Micrarchaeota archaeon]|nr:hypothetical protein [Candidatus Micrarchaeota archaeon]